MNSVSILSQIENQIKSQGWDHYGFVELKPSLSLEFYRQWLAQGFHGEMNYLQKHLETKENPEILWPHAHSAIVMTQDYQNPIPGRDHFPFSQLKIARYAKGNDYHFWFKKKISLLASRLSEMFPHEYFFPACDDRPLLERDLATRAGLGWIGKNTCLINPKKGSLFFIGEIITSMKLNSSTLQVPPDFCGQCTRCLEACPTQAFVHPRELDARKCISYWTIESRGLPPENIRKQMNDWFFGCDICQTVCPWNQKVFGNHELNSSSSTLTRQKYVEELQFILTTSNRKLMSFLKNTPLIRAGGTGLKRNALIIVGNKQLRELEVEVKKYLDHPRLQCLAQWVLEQWL